MHAGRGVEESTLVQWRQGTKRGAPPIWSSRWQKSIHQQRHGVEWLGIGATVFDGTCHQNRPAPAQITRNRTYMDSIYMNDIYISFLKGKCIYIYLPANGWRNAWAVASCYYRLPARCSNTLPTVWEFLQPHVCTCASPYYCSGNIKLKI